MKISVGLPVYDGKLTVPLASCLLTESSIAFKMGHELNIRFVSSCTNLAFGRNHIVKEFLASDDDKLVFVDADVTWEPGAIVKLATHKVDFVGGAYRIKQQEERYPVCFFRGADIGANGLVEAAMVPTGFLALSRSVFDRFREHYPGRTYKFSGDDKVYCYFQIPYQDGSLFTEDSYFCKEWREKGEKLYLDPEIHLTHWQGNIPYPGHIGNWKRKLLEKPGVQ